jgi:hypothetical protein
MKSLLLGFVLTVLSMSSAFAARNFTCHADFNYVGTPFAFSRAWAHSCNGPLCDREKACKNYIESNFLNNNVFGMFSPALDAAAQNKICVAGGIQMRVDYGFEASDFPRKKSWNIFKLVSKTGCKCDYTCPTGYWTEGDKCVKQVCAANSLSGVPAWLNIGSSSYKTDDKGGIRQFINATRGNCRF